MECHFNALCCILEFDCKLLVFKQGLSSLSILVMSQILQACGIWVHTQSQVISSESAVGLQVDLPQFKHQYPIETTCDIVKVLTSLLKTMITISYLQGEAYISLVHTSKPSLCCLIIWSCLLRFLKGCHTRHELSPTEKMIGTDLLLITG